MIKYEYMNIKEFFKNQIAVAIVLGSFLIAIGILGYAFINTNNNKGNSNDALGNIMNQDKIFQGKDFEDNEYILGNKDNDITVVVYSDFECPFCKMLQENTIKKLQEKYSLNNTDITKGKIGIVYRHFAQSYHTKAPTEINAAFCAREIYGQSVYKNFINRIYNITPANNELDLSLLPDITSFAVNEAKENKEFIKKDFDKSEFIECLNKNTYNNELIEDMKDAASIELDGTPYTLVLYKDNDENIIITKISGAKEANYFENIIDKLLKLEK